MRYCTFIFPMSCSIASYLIENEAKNLQMATSILLKFLTLKWNISRTIGRIEVGDGSFYCTFHALSFEPNFFVFDRRFPLSFVILPLFSHASVAILCPDSLKNSSFSSLMARFIALFTLFHLSLIFFCFRPEVPFKFRGFTLIFTRQCGYLVSRFTKEFLILIVDADCHRVAYSSVIYMFEYSKVSLNLYESISPIINKENRKVSKDSTLLRFRGF